VAGSTQNNFHYEHLRRLLSGKSSKNSKPGPKSSKSEHQSLINNSIGTHFDLNENEIEKSVNEPSVYTLHYKDSKSSKRGNINVYLPNDTKPWEVTGAYYSSKSSKGARLHYYLRNETMNTTNSTVTFDDGKTSRVKDDISNVTSTNSTNSTNDTAITNTSSTNFINVTATTNVNSTNFTMVPVTFVVSAANFTNVTATNAINSTNYTYATAGPTSSPTGIKLDRSQVSFDESSESDGSIIRAAWINVFFVTALLSTFML
jgi:hypothetical protein